MARPRKALVVGGDSMLGRVLAASLKERDFAVTATSRRKTYSAGYVFLDLLELDLREISSHTYEVAFICAAETSTLRCELYPSPTEHINVTCILELTRRLTSAGVFVVNFSSNLVFDGTKPRCSVDAPLSPRCAYGRQKAAMEDHLRHEPEVAILRLTKALGQESPLLKNWLLSLKRGEIVTPFYDAVMAPVSLLSAANAAIELGTSRSSGVSQLSAEADITYADAARFLASRIGASDQLIRPVSARAVLPPLSFVPSCTTLQTCSRFLHNTSLDPFDALGQVAISSQQS